MYAVVGFLLEHLRATDGGYLAHGRFYERPQLIVQLRCERHPGADVEQDVIDGIRYYGLRGMIDGQAVGYATSSAGALVNGKEHLDVRLYRLELDRSHER